ncbi:unnamed protein product [Zymoseptoria tritici ST99CH_3D7]|uniref:BRCT domain-containing protein n=1 Tax=Zymoseptoria tritici (strain ST99CH_3D7) TaxID=1276538 RepID=A0A1X7S220_ZYMT9|nr:unnamed protein product [Zymoseptoria tritici ST99CH_3D7]
MASIVESENSLGETQVAHLEMMKRKLMGLDKDGEEDEEQSRGPTIPDSMGQDGNSLPPARSSTTSNRPRKTTSSPKKAPPRFASSASAPKAEMEAMVQDATPRSTLNGVAKAASFGGPPASAFPNGDTQSQDSQVYEAYRESIRRESEEDITPVRRVRSASPNTLGTNVDGDEDGVPERTPRTLMQQESGYVDLEGFLQGRDVSPVNSTQGFEELLDEDQSPETQIHAPPARTSSNGGMPQTPAGLPEGQQGEAMTSITTGPKYSQLFPKADLMGQSQAFHQTQEASSPFPSGPPSDPAMTRPSPNHVASSPMRGFSSPVQARATLKRPAASMSEPRGEYTSMRDSQERRAARLRAEQEKQDLEESDSEDDTQTRRYRDRMTRRALSEQAMRATANVRVMRPSYGQSATKSTRKTGHPIDLTTPGTVARVRWEEDLIEDEEEVEEDGETQVELPNGGEDREEDMDDDAAPEANDDDEYDELQQTVLRSQSNHQEEEDEDGSVVEDDEEHPTAENDELQDTQRPEDDEDEQVDQRAQDGPAATQRSTIADSQPTGQDPPHSAPQQSTHHSSMASFVPGSQYTGKTSEEQAFLKSSRPSQTRVPASPFVTEESEEKLPSSPPLAAGVDSNVSTADDSAEASLARQNLLNQFQRGEPQATGDSANSIRQQEIPDSDLPEQQTSSHANKDDSRIASNEDEESQNRLLYSTARTHVSASASAVSPVKPSQPPSLLHQASSYSPLKAFRQANPASQQSRHLSQQSTMSPRQAVGVRRFGDMTRGGSVMRSFEEDDMDLEGIMDGVMTTDDKAFMKIMSSPKKGRGSSQRKNGGNADVKMNEAEGYTSGLSDPPQQESEGQEMTIPESEHGLVIPAPLPAAREKKVLRDSPSKANKLPTPPTADELDEEKGLTPESALRREREGSRHVSQLIDQRGVAVNKKPRPKAVVYGRKGGRFEKNPAKKGRKARRVVSDDEEEEGLGVVQETMEKEKRDEVVDEVNRSDKTPPPAERVHDAGGVENAEQAEQEAEKDQAERDEAAKEQDEQAATEPTTTGSASAPDRIWALFKGTYNHFYPATWLSSSLDGQTYRIRFDDTTVTDIETQHVRRLELQVGDLLRVDNKGMRKLTYRVVGHGELAATKEVRALGTDDQGRASVKVVAKASRASTAGEEVDEDSAETQDVPINQLYLTHSMWKAYKDRYFTPPNAVALVGGLAQGRSRLSTPSSGVQTPAIDGVSPTRSLRGATNTASTKRSKFTHSHLRDTPLASSSDALGNPTQLFANMAFAITYVSSADEKSAVMDAIIRHGGTILEEGFAELFDIPDLSSSATTPSTSETDPAAHQTLRLKPQFSSLRFVALIADRHSRRAKYMQALALGLPALSGRWVLDCLDPNRNGSIEKAGVKAGVLPWERYMLPAGESSYLSGAIRSRTGGPVSSDLEGGTLKGMIEARPRLLRDEGVLIVASPPPSGVKESGPWERTKTFVFLTLAIGAGRVRRVDDLGSAAELLGRNGVEKAKGEEGWGWVYVAGDVEESYETLVGATSSAGVKGGGRKRKRVVEDVGRKGEHGRERKMIKDGCTGKVLGVDDGRCRVVGDEFVIQSLILGGLVD